MADAPPNNSLFVDIQLLTGGHRTDKVLQALLDCIAVTLAFSCDDIADSDAFTKSLEADLNKAVRRNWDQGRAMRAASSFDGGGQA